MKSAADLQKTSFLPIETPEGHTHSYSLLRSNGVAEKVYTDKMRNKPYSWLANVITIGVERIGSVPVGTEAREEYIRTSGFHVPVIVNRLPLQTANDMVFEIHRTVWKNLIRNQEVICEHCGATMIIDIDLDRVEMLKEDLDILHSKSDWSEIVVDLPVGYEYTPLQIAGGAKEQTAYPDLEGQTFNRMVFRMPTLGDAIRNEEIFADQITFWRKMAMACLTSFQAVLKTEDGKEVVTSEMPGSLVAMLGMKLMDFYLDRTDLEAIRAGLRDNIPSLPFYYKETCANNLCRRETPVVMETSDFFSA